MEHFINTDLSSSSVKGAVSSEGGSEGRVYEHQGGTQGLPACMLAWVDIISLFGDVSKSLENSLMPRQVLSIPTLAFLFDSGYNSDSLKGTSRAAGYCRSKRVTRHFNNQCGRVFMFGSRFHQISECLRLQ